MNAQSLLNVYRTDGTLILAEDETFRVLQNEENELYVISKNGHQKTIGRTFENGEFMIRGGFKLVS